jgi:DNA primase
MADEPVLCFDGDKAGQRAAYRAIDLALPRLLPGKSLKFATLPEGQDPDDLLRSGGREAVAEVIAAARPLGGMLWMREVEGGGFDTPERRAALEARIGAVTASIADDSVRKYYRQDFSARLRQLFERPDAGAAVRDARGNDRWAGRNQGSDWQRSGGGRSGVAPGHGPGPALPRDRPYVVVSQQIATSPVHRGYRTMVPRREALILQTVLQHPWLLHDHLEQLASLEFRHADAERMKGALIDIFAHHGVAAGSPDPQALRAELASRGFADVIGRFERAITTTSVWGALADAAPEDVLVTWQQLVALHRQWHSLAKELKDAEQALGQDNSEANYSWLRDVKARLAVMDGTEALIEGFGASSGRPARSL